MGGLRHVLPVRDILYGLLLEKGISSHTSVSELFSLGSRLH